MVGLLAAFWIALFSFYARVYKKPEYELMAQEAQMLAGAFYKCLETLPGDVYAKIEFVSRYFLPWVGFLITFSSIIKSRAGTPTGEFPAYVPDQGGGNEAPRDSSVNTPGGYAGNVDGLGQPHRFTEYR